MSGLIKNEIIKTFKSGFIKAALCVILALCIIIPLGCYFVNRGFEEVVQDDYYYDSEFVDADLVEYTDKPVEKAYFTAYDKTEKFFLRNGINYDDWRYEYYYNSISSLNNLAAVCGLAADGCALNEAEQFWTDSEMNVSVNFDERHNIVFSEENYKNAFELEKDELSTAAKNIDKMISELESFIQTSDVVEAYKENAEFCKSAVTEAKYNLKNAEEELKKSPENAKLIYERDMAKGALESAELNLWGAEFLEKNECEYDSWQKEAVDDVLMSVSSVYTEAVPMNETMFLGSNEAYFFKDDYKAYLKDITNSLNSAKETEKTVKYALENNIPLPECMGDSVRDSFDSDVSFAAVLVSILMVAVAATTMFSEYSTGSIRLLLIRPKSRSKILLSKLITVIFYGAAAMAASMIVLFILDMLLHGEKDITVPYLLTGSNGEIKEVAPIIYIIVRVLLKMFSSFVIVSAVFMISSLFTKGGILALAIGSAGVCSVSFVSMLAAVFNSDVKGIFSYTILPYLNMSNYYGNYVSSYSMSGDLFADLLDVSMMRSEFSSVIGAILVTVHIALFLGLAFYGFNKKQIKN